jgi:4-diphosphocytidyl-2-C-methyl-D-erythritol kinase
LNGVKLRAHAKINTLLKVGPMRQDGYHEVRTIMQAVDLHDTVELVRSDELSLTCSDTQLSGERNLAWKALRLLSELYEPPPMQIRIEKFIPLASGLGGGSSDAAAVLKGVNFLLGGSILQSDLLAVAAATGVDVRFFVSDFCRAEGTGRGDIVNELPATKRHMVLAMPQLGCASGDAYARLVALGDRADDVQNDFELVAPEESIKLIDFLANQGACDAHLTGSGSAVFGFTESEQEAVQIAQSVRKDGNWAVASHTLEKLSVPEWIA